MSLTIELEAPGELAKFRLHDLPDRQDGGIALTSAERKEAEGLVNLSEMLSLLRVRADRAMRL